MNNNQLLRNYNQQNCEDEVKKDPQKSSDTNLISLMNKKLASRNTVSKELLTLKLNEQMEPVPYLLKK